MFPVQGRKGKVLSFIPNVGGPRGESGAKLFPYDVPAGEWVRFDAEGFSQPACGVVYRKENEVAHGMPLGGIGTGFLDVDTDGTWGMSTLFNSGVPVRGPLRLPFLGINVDGRTWVLTRKETVGTGNAQEIHYWGHYPIVDIEYETTAPSTQRFAHGFLCPRRRGPIQHSGCCIRGSPKK